MSAVWAAEQLGPVRRKVAVKMNGEGMVTRAVAARFESERQALPLMPYIARGCSTPERARRDGLRRDP